ncbi:MAG TPA: hypothetical protein VGJ93_15600 [Desulfuromonadaceae bacterium]|jgi:hypothetical protein
MAVKSKKRDENSEVALLVVEQGKLLEDNPRRQQEERDRLIAHTHQMIGQIKAADMFGKFANVSSLIWLQQVKESKIYRDLPGLGTWEDFCKYIGLSRQKVDLDLQNLATFGEDFLLTVSGLSVGYRDLRKLRQLTHDGELIIDAEAIEIGGERVLLAPEYKEDLQTLIERVIDEKNKALEDAQATVKAKERCLGEKEKEIQKLHKELSKLEDKAAVKEMTAEEDAFLQKMKNLQMGFEGYMLKADPDAAMNGITEITPRMRAALISNLHYMRMLILAAYDTAVMTYGNPATNPEILEEYEAWEKQQLAVEA